MLETRGVTRSPLDLGGVAEASSNSSCSVVCSALISWIGERGDPARAVAPAA